MVTDLGPCAPTNPNPNPGPDPDPDPDPDDPSVCAGGVDAAISEDQRQAFAGELWWETLLAVGGQDEPDQPWPPHPDVPGAVSWLVVSASPVWPVVDPDAAATPWAAVDADDGCVWVATAVQTRVRQLLPWIPGDRQMVQAADAARPEAGLGVYLQRWDNLTAAQRAAVIAYQPDRDITSDCALDVAAVSGDSRAQCSWELPVPGVWHWQARACFSAVVDADTLEGCATLAGGVAWFLSINDYTQQITLDARRGAGR